MAADTAPTGVNIDLLKLRLKEPSQSVPGVQVGCPMHHYLYIGVGAPSGHSPANLRAWAIANAALLCEALMAANLSHGSAIYRPGQLPSLW